MVWEVGAYAPPTRLPIDFQDYTGMYHDLHDKYKHPDGEKDSILEDVVFEMELVKQIEVNIDYILMLVAKYHDSNCEDKEILVAIDKAIQSFLQLRSKKELIGRFSPIKPPVQPGDIKNFSI